MRSASVAVIGGGISGLTAAYELHQQGTPFVLLEKSDRLGGLIFTEQINGFTIDAGPDSLLIQKPAAVELCVELGLEAHLISTLEPRTAYIVRNGMLHALPRGSVFGIPTNLVRVQRPLLGIPTSLVRARSPLFGTPTSLVRAQNPLCGRLWPRFPDKARKPGLGVTCAH